MSDPTILIVPPQKLSAKDKRELVKAGVLVIEMDDPQQARLIRAHSELDSTDLLGAAAKAIGQSSSAETAFAKAVCALLSKASERKTTPPPAEPEGQS